MNVAQQIQTCGYAILPEILGRTTVQRLLNNVEILWTEEQRENPQFARRRPQYIANNLAVRSRAFDAILEHEIVVETAKDLLSDEFILSEIRACNLSQCDDVPFIHRDGYVQSVANDPLAMVAIWTLEEFSADNGGTLLFPGSHHYPFKPDHENTKWFRPLTVEAPPGSLVLFDANLWHGPSANHSGKSRWSLNVVYTHWFIKPYFNMAARLSRNDFNSLSPMMKQLLGFNTEPPKNERERVRTVIPIDQIESYYTFANE